MSTNGTNEQTEILHLRQHVAELEARCQAVTARVHQLEADAKWRHDWHERLGRGAAEPEGRFYERLASEATLREALGDLLTRWGNQSHEHPAIGKCADELDAVLGAAPREGHEGR